MNDASQPHIPVLLNEMLAALHPRDGEVYVDGTFGAGGYSKAILDKAHCTVIGIDRDPEAKATGLAMQQQYAGRFHFIAGNFDDMPNILEKLDIHSVHGVVLDIGVSSMQLDSKSRGFSFRFDAPLDMRMSKQGETAAEFLARADEKDITYILKEYGEEAAAKKIARAIVKKRDEAPIATTKELSDLVHDILGPKRKIDPATRTFQALRIYVNDELSALKRALPAAESVLKPEGRLVVVTFHSLEDRIVKQFLKEKSETSEKISRHLPKRGREFSPTFTLARPTKVRPSEEELLHNSKARSATLRRGIRTAYQTGGAA